MILYTKNNPEFSETLNPLHLFVQLKDVTETLEEREEELELWRQEQYKYAEAQSMNDILEDDLIRAKDEIHDLKTKVMHFITREQVFLNEHTIDAHLQESYTTLFEQYQEGVAKIEDLEIRLEEATIKYQKLLPYVHRLVEVEAKLAIALKEVENMKQGRGKNTEYKKMVTP
jgi:hypothetical protein